ncbi:DUF302 domain-containing protein [Marinovum sp.]|uniref:DUF302 domain-containing protein n=1 Tax=Marinovum sp. TaxID=2024839 RepID=UPI002B26A613|nr:DUF302 domain-containing protein [Marinovum sp.]
MKYLLPLILAAGAACAEEPVIVHPYDGNHADALFSLENAIINQGLVVDYHSQVGEMLARTREDVGGAQIFEAADVLLFCSATVSRQVMEADPLNVAYCPYGIFVTEREGQVEIGYRSYPEGPMDAVEELLGAIVEEALAF